MKKSLSVLLAGALAFGSFASLASAADLSVADKYQELVNKGILKGTTAGGAQLDSKLTRAQFATIAAAVAGLPAATTGETFSDVKQNQWWYGAIEAAAKGGLVNGTGAGKFSPRSDVTVESVIKVAVTLVGQKPVDKAVVTGASVWAGPYVQAAIDAGLISNRTDYKSFATRGQTIDIVYNAYVASQAATVVSAKVVDSKNVEVTMSDKEVVKVALPTALEANKETAITFTYKGKEYTTKVTYVVTSATKVSAVAASNLKEVVVSFDGEVDKTTAENEDNYSLASGTVDSAALSDDKKTVTLTLVGTLGQQAANKLTVKGVKAGDKVIEVKDFGFTPLDNTLPTVTKIEALGNKAIKVTFSEPIKASSSLNYKLDGKSFYGSSDQGTAEVILTPYDSSALSAGEHTLTSQNVADYNDLKSLISDNKFTVVADSTAPTVTNVDATLEKVTVTFSEEIDPATLNNANVYWKSGTTKYAAASNKKVGSGKYEFDFFANPLPAYETTLYVEGVKDYSGNAISATSVAVKPAIDQTRPEVVQVKAASDNMSFTVKFNKKVKDVSASNFLVTDKDGKVRSVNNVTLDSAGTTATVNLYSALPEGTNTVKVSGVTDATTLKNTMLDYTTTLSVGDASAPSIAGVSTNANSKQVVINFSEKMDVTTLVNPSNYLITFNGAVQTLPSDTQIGVIQDQKAVLLTFADKIGGKDLNFGTTGLTKIRVLGVKDVEGNMLSEFTGGTTANELTVAVSDTVDDVSYSSNYAPGVHAVVVDKKTIKVKFDKAIAIDSTKAGLTLTSALAGNANIPVDSIIADGSNVVTIKTVNEMATNETPTIDFATGNGLKTVTGSAANAVNVASTAVLDKVAPEVKLGSATTYAVSKNAGTGRLEITVPFSEGLEGTAAAGDVDSYYANDLIVTRVSDNTVLTAGTDYTTTLDADDGSNLIVTVIAGSDTNSKYTVEVKNANYITDLSTGKNAPNFAVAKAAVATDKTVLDFDVTTTAGTMNTASPSTVTDAAGRVYDRYTGVDLSDTFASAVYAVRPDGTVQKLPQDADKDLSFLASTPTGTYDFYVQKKSDGTWIKFSIVQS